MYHRFAIHRPSGGYRPGLSAGERLRYGVGRGRALEAPAIAGARSRARLRPDRHGQRLRCALRLPLGVGFAHPAALRLASPVWGRQLSLPARAARPLMACLTRYPPPRRCAAPVWNRPLAMRRIAVRFHTGKGPWITLSPV